jgi:hypothetical protein
MLGKLLATGLLGAGVLGIAAMSSACGSSDTTAVDCTADTPKKYSELSGVMAKCTNCHATTRTGDQRHGATVGYDYDTYDAAKMAAQLGASDVDGTGANIMPPVGQNCPKAGGPACTVDNGGAVPSLSATEKKDFLVWAQCGTPN